ncbi:hypothetical protein [Mycolicibacterium moriokaense]|nr:hypothetical protein [Mycolicibacterium moriokaense]
MESDPSYQDMMVADRVFGPVWSRPGLSRRDPQSPLDAGCTVR